VTKRLLAFSIILSAVFPVAGIVFTAPILAQTQTNEQAEAQRLFDEGLQLFQQQTASSYQQAIKKWEATLPLWRKLGDKANEAKTLVIIGFIYDALGEQKQALDYFQQALPLLQTLGDRAVEAKTLNNIGGIYIALGEQKQSLDYFQQALPLSRALGDRVVEATTLNNIGVVYIALGEQ